jgi:prepilin-type N-terminal cleavage/methylation domain-containing protein
VQEMLRWHPQNGKQRLPSWTRRACRRMPAELGERLVAAHAARRPGYSLLELIAVVTIVGMLTAVALPRFAASLNRYRADAAARRIAADIDRLRLAARRTSTQQSIVFNVAGNSYSSAGVTNLDHSGSTFSVSLSDAPYQATLSQASFGSGSTLTFNGFGIPSAGGTVVIQSGATSHTITVDANTGRAAIQ